MSKKYGTSGKAKSFFKRNMYYIIMIVCILAIAAMITTAVLLQRDGTVPDPDPGPGQQDPGPGYPGVNYPDPGGGDDDYYPTITPEPIVFVSPVTNMLVVREHTVTELVHWVALNHFAVHRGVAFDGEAGTPVMAAFGGTVTRVVSSGNDQFNGNQVHIYHGDGLVTIYEAMGDVNVTVGQTVQRGQVIGAMGRAGRKAELGNHLHFEVQVDGVSVDPFLFLPDDAK